MNNCTAFFISDGTGITSETLGHSLMSQFEHVEFQSVTLPYLDTPEKAREAIARINEHALTHEKPPVVFATLVRDDIRQEFKACKGLMIDFFTAFLGPLEKTLGEKSTYTIGRTHSMHNLKNYQQRIDAINFTLNTDDGANHHQYETADVILVGVSRSGKTPTCLYLALQYAIKAANYPITEEDLGGHQLPKILHPFRQKLFGLSIDADHLQSIRQERRPDSRYASMRLVQQEIRALESIFRQEKIPFLNTTTLSIEEIATKILESCGVQRQLF